MELVLTQRSKMALQIHLQVWRWRLSHKIEKKERRARALLFDRARILNRMLTTWVRKLELKVKKEYLRS